MNLIKVSRIIKPKKMLAEIANVNFYEYYTTVKLNESMDGPPTCPLCGDMLDEDGKNPDCSLKKLIICPFDKYKIDVGKFFEDFK